MEIKSLKTKDYGSGFSLVDTDLINQLETDFEEAIKALTSVYEDYTEHNTEKIRCIIEKACGESWEKIRGKI